MTASEFDIINRYFMRIAQGGRGIELGPGDDCAVLSTPEGCELCISTDSLVEGVHFPKGSPAGLVASRTLAANLSDLAAMGASPHSFLLAITMPGVDESWLDEFSATLATLSERYHAPLVGGNLSRGNLSLTITIIGTTPVGEAVTRAGAKAGDAVYVTGTLGDAARGLELVRSGDTDSFLARRYSDPTPRLAAGEKLRGLANAMIDISDGLMADLGHIAGSSGLGAQLLAADLPLSSPLIQSVGVDKAVQLALFCGDDYELCFTVDAARESEIRKLTGELDLNITRVGKMVEGKQVVALDKDGQSLLSGSTGYRHF